jgi:kynureninase
MNPLARHYSRFRVSERLLLTGHSHQAWPDVAFDAQQRAWLDAADLVDDKWQRAQERAARVREGFARLLGDAPAYIALGQNTHELMTRLISALPIHERPRILTTDAEFHSARRQLDRLGEEGFAQIAKVAARPVDTLTERMAARVDDRTACVLVSSVLYDTAEIVPDLHTIAEACGRAGAELLVDAYHHLNVVPFDIDGMGLHDAFVTGGGYKYCQLGEGNAFLRVPSSRRMRPLLTGWFAEFEALDHQSHGEVAYPPGAGAFAGAHYRAAAVFRFHTEQGLDPKHLREVNTRQVTRLKAGIEALDLDRRMVQVVAMPDERRGGFLALRSPRAAEIARRLRAAGVFTDARGEILRLGPAPYLTETQLDESVAALGVVAAG